MVPSAGASTTIVPVAWAGEEAALTCGRTIGRDGRLDISGAQQLVDPADQGTFEFGYVDAAKSAYEFRVSAQFLNGMTQDFDAKRSDADDLSVEL